MLPALAPLRLFGGPSLLEDVITTILSDATKVGVLDFDINRREIDERPCPAISAVLGHRRHPNPIRLGRRSSTRPQA